MEETKSDEVFPGQLSIYDVIDEKIIITGFNSDKEAKELLRNDINYLRTTQLNFNVDYARREIYFPDLHKRLLYKTYSENVDGCRKKVNCCNHNLQNILKGMIENDRIA